MNYTERLREKTAKLTMAGIAFLTLGHVYDISILMSIGVRVAWVGFFLWCILKTLTVIADVQYNIRNGRQWWEDEELVLEDKK